MPDLTAIEAPVRLHRPCLVVDIETAPDERLWNDTAFALEIRNGLSAPSNYKDPAKIEAYIEDAWIKARANAALSWCHGKIRSIAWGDLHLDDEPDCVASENEAEVIGVFADALHSGGGLLIGGFNIREFDVPFISFRAAVHEIEMPAWWPQKRAWDRIVDPVDVLGRNGKLADHLRALGLPAKLGDGADAPSLSLDDLQTYNKWDVHVERLLIRRLLSSFPMLRLTRDRHAAEID